VEAGMKPIPLPRITVVTPSFNQARFLEQTIDSVLSQDYPRLKYIIVDGGSTDGSVEIIKKYEKHLAWWVSEKDRGQTDAINKGFGRARGDVFAWLNSDDTYEPGAVGAAAKLLVNFPEVGMMYANANYIDEAGRIIGRFPAAQTDYRRLRQGYVHIPQQTAFFRAALWNQLGPLDPSFFFAMDYDLWTRIAAVTEMKYVHYETWANFRIHSAAKTISNDDRCWPEMMRVHYRDGGGPISIINAKYQIRKLAAPLINWWRRRTLLREGGD
jgi:glycosyltransferase involved in cell wall biosynthesis